jgi:hypothetical protein
MEEKEINEIIQEHGKVWSERNPEIRRTAIKKIYAGDVQVVAHEVFNGLEAMDNYIINLLIQGPDYLFQINGPVESQHHTARAYWQFDPPSDSSRITGQDFFTFGNGKITGVFAFLDQKNRLNTKNNNNGTIQFCDRTTP